MAAGQGFKTFNTGDVLTAADVNGYLMQGVLVFASAAARDAAITSPQEGQFAFTKDTNGLWYYDGAAWVASGATGDIEGVTAGVGISGGGTSGTVTVTNSMATAIDAKGDLVVGTGADTFSRIAVGANNTVLTADSAEATGVKWATAAAGGMTLLSTTTLSGATTAINSISQSYKSLQIMIYGLTMVLDDVPILRFRNSTTDQGFFSDPANTWISTGTQSPGATDIYLDGNAGSVNNTGGQNNWLINLSNYTSTTAYARSFSVYGIFKDAASANDSTEQIGALSGTSAIDSITLSVGGTTFNGGTVKIWGLS